MNPKEIVAQGYDRIAARYTAWASTVRQAERVRYTSLLLEELPERAQVLELGCGAGVPTTRQLADRFSVTGVDISSAQIALARQNVPTAQFIVADMCQLKFPPGSFDGVAAFYSIIHVPREEQANLLTAIATWLRPNGLLVATLGVNAVEGDVDKNWLGWGVPMYWSHLGDKMARDLIENAGLQIVRADLETAEEDGAPVTFLWVVARKPV
ncbi:MAG: class I SAM-dependent methyltransferase [Chloroflexi bacterium]|nr:class I SAM-dependent methyltransferase [Chloroflexota bacterium]